MLAFQKEIFESGQSFFFGKMDVVELPLFTKEKLVEAYESEFGSTYPFERDTLLELANFSAGIFRRFLQFVSIALGEWLSESNRSKAINARVIKRPAVMDEMLKAMENDLVNAFPKSSVALRNARRVLDLLMGNPNGVSQKSIAQKLDLSEMEMSRIADKLESYGYILRERGLKSEKTLKIIMAKS